MRVVVAMSGGVDSSVAAGLMVEQGHEVVGLTMKLRDTTAEERAGRSASCCSPDDVMDARGVCDLMGIPHYTADYRDAFRRAVMEPFARAYLQGRTPNPCVLCNDHLKFAALLTRARALGADLLVTGHYARTWTDADGRVHLGVAADARKDQSYFLFGIAPEALARIRFPLGDMDKPAVRGHAKRLGLPIWDKPDSEDICFVPGGDYARVVEEILAESGAPPPPAGRIVDEAGRELGRHEGIHRFTVGQRKGLGVSRGEPLYVLGVDAASGDVRVGDADGLGASGLVARDCNWLVDPPSAEGRAVTARIRYRHAGVPARVHADGGGGARVEFETAVRAVSPGQAVVFYDGDEVLGGGWIERPIPWQGRPAAGETHVRST
jgi:tRNA-specific 2-thiouridylase